MTARPLLLTNGSAFDGAVIFGANLAPGVMAASGAFDFGNTELAFPSDRFGTSFHLRRRMLAIGEVEFDFLVAMLVTMRLAAFILAFVLSAFHLLLARMRASDWLSLLVTNYRHLMVAF